jgi:hypothetical protein
MAYSLQKALSWDRHLPMNKMVERGAKALTAELEYFCDWRVSWLASVDHERLTRAVIAAMREASDDMADAVAGDGYGITFLDAHSIWQNMIDAALTPGDD